MPEWVFNLPAWTQAPLYLAALVVAMLGAGASHSKRASPALASLYYSLAAVFFAAAAIVTLQKIIGEAWATPWLLVGGVIVSSLAIVIIIRFQLRREDASPATVVAERSIHQNSSPGALASVASPGSIQAGRDVVFGRRAAPRRGISWSELVARFERFQDEVDVQVTHWPDGSEHWESPTTYPYSREMSDSFRTLARIAGEKLKREEGDTSPGSPEHAWYRRVASRIEPDFFQTEPDKVYSHERFYGLVNGSVNLCLRRAATESDDDEDA